MKKDNRESFSRFSCSCGNPVSFKGKQCGQCLAEIMAESDGHAYRSENIDRPETDYDDRLADGFEMLHLNQ